MHLCKLSTPGTLLPIVASLFLCVIFTSVDARANELNKTQIFVVDDRRPDWLDSPISGEQVSDAQFINFSIISVAPYKDDLSQLIQTTDSQPIPKDESWEVKVSPGPMTPFEFAPTFFSRLRAAINRDGKGECVIFVHGCCISRKDALKQAATLSLAFNCPVLLFDWATLGWFQAPPLPEINTYRKSERATELSEVNFAQLMEKLMIELPTAYITVVGHSMGNRMVDAYLLHSPTVTHKTIDEVHFVRADVSLPAYLASERAMCSKIGKAYVYISNNDPALALSRKFSSGVPREGMPDELEYLFSSQSDGDEPRNRGVLDVSALSLGHGIPFDLLGNVHRVGLHCDTRTFKTIPLPNNSRFVRLQVSQQE